MSIIEQIFNESDKSVTNQLIETMITTHDLEHHTETIHTTFKSIKEHTSPYYYMTVKQDIVTTLSTLLEENTSLFLALLITFNNSPHDLSMFITMRDIVTATPIYSVITYNNVLDLLSECLKNHRFNLNKLSIHHNMSEQLRNIDNKSYGGALTKSAIRKA